MKKIHEKFTELFYTNFMKRMNKYLIILLCFQLLIVLGYSYNLISTL